MKPTVTRPAWKQAVKQGLLFALALLILHTALTFGNWWPTPAIRPTLTLSVEFLILVGVLAAAAALTARAREQLIAAASWLYIVLAASRYAEVTLPALFGRPINLYWDGPHIPGLLALAWQQMPGWQSLAIAAGIAALAVGVHRALRWSMRRVVETFATMARRASRRASAAAFAGAAAGLAILLVPAVGNLSPGAGPARLWDFVADPVVGTWLQQGRFIANALSVQRTNRLLPPSPAFDGNLAGLGGSDVTLVFLESYGAAAYDNPDYSRHLQPRRDALADTLDRSGRHAVSAFVRSPTFGGGSWLAHASLLSGIDVSDPGNYDLLLTTRRPTLVSHFRRQGYETVALMPGIRQEWPEGSFYGYDILLDSRGLGYQGPEFGFWRIPDQFSMERYNERRRTGASRKPQFMVFPTITSHIPFGPVPPYQSDWSRLTTSAPYEPAPLARSLGSSPDWLNLGPAYVQTIAYSFDWITGYVGQPESLNETLILVGDHQPAASVSGRGASWDVPVHLITGNAELARRFVSLGFTPGLSPKRLPLGSMSVLTELLLQGLSL